MTHPPKSSLQANSSNWFFVLHFFFNDTATTEIYPLSLHDALPISLPPRLRWNNQLLKTSLQMRHIPNSAHNWTRSIYPSAGPRKPETGHGDLMISRDGLLKSLGYLSRLLP